MTTVIHFLQQRLAEEIVICHVSDMYVSYPVSFSLARGEHCNLQPP